MIIDDQDDDGTDIQSFLRTIDDSTSTIKGHIKVSNLTDASQFLLFTITSMTEQSGYFKVVVSNVDSSAGSPFSDGEECVLTFARFGDVGDTGPQGEEGDQGIQGIQGIQGVAGNDGSDGSDGSDLSLIHI